MYTRFFVFVFIATFSVAVIYSSISPDLYALKVKSVKLCEKSTANGITTETCCQLETDSSTEKTTQYCTECKTASGGEDLGCTHSQTDVGLTINDGKLGIKPIGPKLLTDKLPTDKIPTNGILNDGGLTTRNEGGKDNDSVDRKGLDTRKELESQDKLGNFEIQDLLSDKDNKTID
jgi:hypothetical protein